MVVEIIIRLVTPANAIKSRRIGRFIRRKDNLVFIMCYSGFVVRVMRFFGSMGAGVLLPFISSFSSNVAGEG